MGLLTGIKNSIAFLTVIPVGMDRDGLIQSASYMPLFPVIGGLIGLIVGVSVWMLEAIFPPLIASMIGLGVLLLITGAHHTDGLLDFGDALMSHASREEKIRILHDPQTGAGGLILGLIVLGTTAFSIANLGRGVIIQSMVASEAAAKFSLVFEAAAGKSAFLGMNTQFVKAMHGRLRWPRFAAAAVLLLVSSLATLQVVGVAVAFSAIVTGTAMLAISENQFGGVTGDVMGATNDLARMVAFLTILAASKWL